MISCFDKKCLRTKKSVYSPTKIWDRCRERCRHNRLPRRSVFPRRDKIRCWIWICVYCKNAASSRRKDWYTSVRVDLAVNVDKVIIIICVCPIRKLGYVGRPTIGFLFILLHRYYSLSIRQFEKEYPINNDRWFATKKLNTILFNK